MSKESERRVHERFPVDAEVRVRAAGASGPGVPCRLADASVAGVSVRTDEHPGADRILVEILAPDGEPVGDPLDASVVRVDPDPDGGYRIGCRFEVPDELVEPED